MPSKTRRHIAATLLLAAALPALAQPAATQPGIPRGGLNPDSFYGKETFQGVSVRDSLEAIKKLEDARRMERLEDWNKAADWYQEVIEKYGQYVVPSGTDAQNNIRQYTGIERPVQEQLSKWPKQGLDAYRNRYGGVAAGMLEQARQDDRETLSRIMKLYFVTEAGKQAGIRLVDLLLEGGEFPEAARVGDRLLDWHPTLVVERPKMLFRTALAYHLSGDEKKSKERAEQLRTKHAGAVGTLFGKDIVLADALDQLQQVAPPVSIATASSSVRLNPGGDESRSMISAAKGRPGARLATLDLAPPPPMRNLPNGVNGDVNGMVQTRDGSNLGILPVADDGEMYFQDGSRVYAVSLQSGVPLPGWIQTYPSTGGQYAINCYGTVRNQQYTLTLTDSAVLGVMGYSDRLANYGIPVYGSDRGTRLACLDRATGKLKWEARPNKIAEENLRALDFSGSPLVVGDNVYVIGRGGKNFTAEDCYVLCFDLNSGSYKWSCFIASSNNATAFNGQVATSDTLSHLAYSSGRIYVLTNVGACAALDAYSGTVSWLNIYPRDNSAMNENMGWNRMGGVRMNGGGGSTKPWEYNPVVVQEGKVFILPTDAKHVMVYDAGSGAELKRIALGDFQKRPEDAAGPQAMIAVDGNQMFLTGGACIYCIDWTQPANSCILWFSQFPTNIKGRAFATADSIFLCTESGMVQGKAQRGGLHRIERFNPATGKITGRVKESYPSKRDWDEGEGPGNVLVTGDQVVVAGAKRVNVYADMVLARKRLDDDVAAAPNDPEPRLRYAEVMFVAGQLPVAMEKLGDTVKLLGGLKAMRPGPERDHFFSDCVTFAAKLQKDKKGDNIEEMIDTITKLYDLAAAAADGDSQQVNYRVSRAKFNRNFVQEDSHQAAVALYQEILTSPRLRTVPLTDDEVGGTTQASIVAEKMINEVKKEKPKAYEAFEKIAADALVTAGSDPAMLKVVAESYPNSAAAPKAMIAAASAYEALPDYRLAAHTLRQVYTKYGDAAGRPRLLEDMARNYLAMPDRIADRVDTAAARLSAAVRLGAGATPLAKPFTLPDKTVLAAAGTSVEEALNSVRNYKAKTVSGRLPDFHVPPRTTAEQRQAYRDALKAWQDAGALDLDKKPRLPEPFIPAAKQLVLNDVDVLVQPPLDLRMKNARHDRVVAWSNGNLQVYPVGAARSAGTSDALGTPPKNLAWLNNNAALLVWGDRDLVMLDGNDAAKKWTVALKSLPKIDVVAGTGNDEVMSQNNDNAAGVEQQQIFVGGGRPMLIRRRMLNGQIVAQQIQAVGAAAPAPAPVPAGAEAIASVRPVDDKIVVATTAGQLFALRTADGSIAWHTRLAASAPITRVAATDDFIVAKVDDANSVTLVAVDTLTGQIVRRFSFGNEGGGGNVPVNFALAPDGTLVWIQQDRLCGKDLFEPKKEPNYEVIAGQADAARGPNVNGNINVQVDGQLFAPIYAGAVNPDQLLISEGRIVVVNQNGRFVSVHSLETGKLLDFQQGDGKRVEARLSTCGGDTKSSVNDWGVALHIVGPKLYVCSRGLAPVCYNLDKIGVVWNGSIASDTPPNVQFQEPLIGQDHLVLVDRAAPKAAAAGAGPAAANPNATGGTTLRLHCYSRAIDAESGRESGVIDHYPFVRDDTGINDLQGVDGGFYYLTGDKKLHFLKGARP